MGRKSRISVQWYLIYNQICFVVYFVNKIYFSKRINGSFIILMAIVEVRLNKLAIIHFYSL